MPIHQTISVELICDYCPSFRAAHFTRESGTRLTIIFRKFRESGWRTFPAQGKAKCPACCSRPRVKD